MARLKLSDLVVLAYADNSSCIKAIDAGKFVKDAARQPADEHPWHGSFSIDLGKGIWKYADQTAKIGEQIHSLERGQSESNVVIGVYNSRSIEHINEIIDAAEDYARSY